MKISCLLGKHKMKRIPQDKKDSKQFINAKECWVCMNCGMIEISMNDYNINLGKLLICNDSLTEWRKFKDEL